MCVQSFQLIDPNTMGVIQAWKVFHIAFPLSNTLPRIHSLNSDCGPYPVDKWVHCRDYMPRNVDYGSTFCRLSPLEGAPSGFMAYKNYETAKRHADYFKVDCIKVRLVELYGIIAKGIESNNGGETYIAKEMKILPDTPDISNWWKIYPFPKLRIKI